MNFIKMILSEMVKTIIPKLILAVTLFSLSVSAPTSVRSAQQQFITIGTGGVTGVYYPTGEAICRMVNSGKNKHGVRCSVESTGGSVYNLNALRIDELDMGVVQSDWQYHAFKGTSSFTESGPDNKLRAVFSLHLEPFTVVARRDAAISTFDDLKGKRVNVGNPGSGQRGTMEVLMEAMGWKMSDFALVSELSSSLQAAALCNNEVDAIVFTVGHPSNSISEAVTSCDTVLVQVIGKTVEKLVQENDYYSTTVIPGGTYSSVPDDVMTFGVGATVVSSSDVSPDVIYTVVKSVFSNLNKFKRMHPAFGNLDPKKMIKDALSAPLHDGAMKYFKESGLK